ncbi:mobilization protein [Staphylococcus haemolyticus]|uniref:mobilization protein n=1 Tax=Staphylococcus haemolyticus TaxID=1283 RepID=UPI001F31166C|nr:mobilization protein [Staphylococcus haemolyticus]
MFFIVALVMITFVVLSPLGDLLGVQHFYDWINHVLKTGHSAWRYLIVTLYLFPYILFSLLIYAILKGMSDFNRFLRLNIVICKDAV